MARRSSWIGKPASNPPRVTNVSTVDEALRHCATRHFDLIIVMSRLGQGGHVELSKALRKASALFLATDPDREGEAISWHLHELLKERGDLGPSDSFEFGDAPTVPETLAPAGTAEAPPKKTKKKTQPPPVSRAGTRRTPDESGPADVHR